jgi:hypothetical protein
MSEYVGKLMEAVKAKDPAQPEFHQAVEEVADSVHHRAGTSDPLPGAVGGRSG